MIEALRSWMRETHRSDFELVRHFLPRFFDSELVSSPGEWRKIAIGLFAAFLSLSIVGVRTYFGRYNFAHFQPDGQTYQQFVREDMLSFIGLVMVVTALLTLLEWQSLFPSMRDLLALASLPVSPRQVFQAKFASLLIFFSGFALTIAGPIAVAFAAVSSGRWQTNPALIGNVGAVFAALAGACVFVFFSLLAVQGFLLNLLPSRLFGRVTVIVQASLFVSVLAAAPMLFRQPAGVGWWPPTWFLNLWESLAQNRVGAGRSAWLAVAIPPIVCVLTYLSSYHRYRRLLLESERSIAAGNSAFGSWLLEKFAGEPRQQAAFAFIWKTLTRSRLHRLILLSYAGSTLGWVVNAALDTRTPALRDQGMYGFLSVVVPLALSMMIAAALRYAFSWPVSLQANWMFRIIDRDGATAWLESVERFVIWIGVAPVFVLGYPAVASVLGPVRAAAAMTLGFFAALIWFEAIFRQWRKLPFTCSYVPAKRPILLTMLRYAFIIGLLVPAGHLILSGSANVITLGALLSFEIVVWRRLRSERRQLWRECTLMYVDEADPDVSPLELQAAEGTLEGKADQNPEIFSGGTLVASRGIIPHDWAEEMREERRRPALLFETLLEDVRFAIRLIRRNPLVASVVVLTLTIGIGINASAFTVVDAFALRPHVYKDPDSFLRVVPKRRFASVVRPATYPEYMHLRSSSRTVRQLAAFTPFPAFIGKDDSAGSVGLAVSCNIFVVDGSEKAVMGRLLTEDDCVRGVPAVAVISESIWRARFASNPNAIGQIIQLNNRPIRIAGVAADRTTGWTRKTNIWVPFTAQEFFEPGSNLFAGDEYWLAMAGRLSPGFSRRDAEAELSALINQQATAREHGGSVVVTNDGSWLEEIQLRLNGRQLALLGFFFGAFNLVLFVSCANVATILLSRAAARRQEIAIRLSLGAPRVRLVRMLVTESVLLALVAGVISAALAWRIPPRLFEMIAGIQADFPINPAWRTFAFVASVVMITGVLAGLAPALETLRQDLNGSLKTGGGGAPGGLRRGFWNTQGVLVSAQVALSMALLVEASLFSRAEDRTTRADPGFLSRDVVVAHVWYPDNTPIDSVANRTAAIAQRARALPGVHSVAFSAGIPMWAFKTVEIKPPGRPDAIQPVDVYTASPGFFDTLGMRIVRGRDFQPNDYSAIVVSEGLANLFWRREDPIGKTLTLPDGSFTVAGVVKDVDPLRFGGSENPVLYSPWRIRTANVMSVRFDRNAATGASAVRAAIGETDPTLQPMAQRLQVWIDHVTKELWNVVGIIVILGFVAITLSATGIYGAVSFAVNQRTKELAIRTALGARKLDIVWEVFRSGGLPVARGLLAGLWLSVATAGGLHETTKASPLRLDVSNPMLYGFAALLIVAAAMAAMAIPARRGIRTDPLNALRCE